MEETILSDLTGESTVIKTIVDANGEEHQLAKLGFTINKKGKKYTKGRACNMCTVKNRGRTLSGGYCISCNMRFCYSFTNCDAHGRNCFEEHVQDINESTQKRVMINNRANKRQKRMLTALS